ncbi:Fungal specific transcription factor domain containing protein [Hyaloscypha variabilis]
MQGRRADFSSRGQHAHLPPIAPRQEPEHSSDSIQNDSTQSASTHEIRRNRLPPRSRSGCWTCRTRKVKCDEQRPACGQCVRLKHLCDYNPRLTFKDDTSRIIDRMQEVSRTGSVVWDSSVPELEQNRELLKDSLPPFSALETDEEREMKAELTQPGKYFVIANPRSFELLPEYRDWSISQLDPTQELLQQGQIQGNEDSACATSRMEDANTIILSVFEEPTRRGSTQLPTIPSTPPSSYVFPPIYPLSDHQRELLDPNAPELDNAQAASKDYELLQLYRAAISHHIAEMIGHEDVFEIQAQEYPPLFHAMMALAALSLAHKNGSSNTDALEHYQQVIPALKTMVRSSQDSYSDGPLLTHTFLLLYEIAAGEPESNMWQHHSDQLLRIVTLRRQSQITEGYDFIVWMICRIDVYALLCANGKGRFIEGLLKQNMLPSPERCLPPTSESHLEGFPPEEQPYFPALIGLNQEVLLLALQVGQLARDLRVEAKQKLSEDAAQIVSDSTGLMSRRTRIEALHNLVHSCQDSWRTHFPSYWTWSNDYESLPERVFASVANSYMLFRACLIYAHTSMFPHQMADSSPEIDLQVATCAREIIQVARLVLFKPRVELRFAIFPLFMAGFSTTDLREKEEVLDIMRKIENHGYGGSMESVIKLLEIVFEHQAMAILRTGTANSVEWVEEMEIRGLMIYGL